VPIYAERVFGPDRAAALAADLATMNDWRASQIPGAIDGAAPPAAETARRLSSFAPARRSGLTTPASTRPSPPAWGLGTCPGDRAGA
jgi:hypothetical protein